MLFARFLFRGKERDRMTEFQEQQIRLMREQGIGYRLIGNRLGLSRDIVRNYCRSRKLDGHYPKIWKNR